MEPDKNLKDALLRSHQATEKDNQDQSQLNQMAAKAENTDNQAPEQPELNEKPINLLRSWDTLRQLDEALVNKDDLPENKKE